jgi:putative tryptophan/tyrosine transport system substrate-binding protein
MSCCARLQDLGFLANPKNPGATDVWAKDAQMTARSIGIEPVMLNATDEREVEAAFAHLSQSGADGLLVAPDPFLTSQAGHIIALVAGHAVPAVYSNSDNARPAG